MGRFSAMLPLLHSPALVACACLIAPAAFAEDSTVSNAGDESSANESQVTTEVEVRGSRGAPPPRDPVAAGSVLRRDRLEAPGATAADVLRTEPGLAVQETGGFGALSTARVRGATAAQTPVYLAGIRLNDDVGGTADLSTVPLWLLDRVEIYRSNAPLDGDALGIGGAIFFEPRLPARTEASTGVMGGSYGAHALWATAGIGNDDHTGGVLVGARFEGARNDYPYPNDNGTSLAPTHEKDDATVVRHNAEARAVDLWIVASEPLHDGRVSVVTNLETSDQGLPGSASGSGFVMTKRASLAKTRVLMGVQSRTSCGASCTLSTATHLLFAHQSYDDPLGEAALAASHLDVTADRVEESLSVTYRPFDAWWFSPAAHVAVERLAMTADTTVPSPPFDARRADARAALSTGVAVTPAITLFGLGAGECHGTQTFGKTSWVLTTNAPDAGTGADLCSEVEPSARGGIELSPGSKTVSFVANVSRYARVPTLGERYGISGTIRGKRDLEAEHGTTFDLGTRVRGRLPPFIKHAFIDAFGFVRSSSNLIAYTFGSTYALPVNIGASRTVGADLLAGIDLPAGVDVEMAVTMLDARDTSASRATTNDRLPFLPALILAPRAELGGRIDAPPFSRGKIALSYRYEASRYGSEAGFPVLPSQTSFDVEGELAVLDDTLVVRARGVDLFDQPRFDFIGFPLPPRSFYIALEAHVP